MELSSREQIFELIKKSGKILLALPENLNADSLASALALKLFVKKLGKEAEVVSSGKVPANVAFLPGSNGVINNIQSGKSFIVNVDVSQKKLAELSYQTADNKVQIYLKSEGGEFEPADISFGKEGAGYDLIISLGAKSLEDFGKFYEQHTDLFFETPKINIDNQAGNEYFGAVNLIDVTATSVCEILTELFQKYETQLVDEDIATCLLAGIIEKTGSFQSVKTTPKSFAHASELIALGGRQQEIIKHIYKTKSLPLLKLWGRALARMKIPEGQGVIYSLLNHTDFEKAEATEKELLPALKEFIDNVSGYKIIALLTEPSSTEKRLIAAVHEQISATDLLQRLGGQGKISEATIGNYKVIEQTFTDISLEALEKKFVEIIKI